MRRPLALLLALAAAGCTSSHTLATCKGPLLALNAPHWRPIAVEMAALEKACPEDR
jgi:hypothetical protein